MSGVDVATTETCPIEVWPSGAWRPYVCGRPVKRDGMCGIHARMAEQREKRRAEWLASRENGA